MLPELASEGCHRGAVLLPRPALGQQKPQGSSPPSRKSADASAAPLDRQVPQLCPFCIKYTVCAVALRGTVLLSLSGGLAGP